MTGFEVTSYSASHDTYRTSKEGRSQAGASTAFGEILDSQNSLIEGGDEAKRFGYGSISVLHVSSPMRLTDMIAKNPSLEQLFSKLPENEYQAHLQAEAQLIEQMKAALEGAHSQAVGPDPSRYPALQTYASVVVNGQIVATIDNQGVYKTSPDVASKLSHLLPNDFAGGNGPDLAQARADIMARALGGKVVKADTALSQGQFLSLPEYRQEWAVDHAAMLNDPAYQEIQQAQTRLDNLQRERAEYLARGA